MGVLYVLTITSYRCTICKLSLPSLKLLFHSVDCVFWCTPRGRGKPTPVFLPGEFRELPIVHGVTNSDTDVTKVTEHRHLILRGFKNSYCIQGQYWQRIPETNREPTNKSTQICQLIFDKSAKQPNGEKIPFSANGARAKPRTQTKQKLSWVLAYDFTLKGTADLNETYGKEIQEKICRTQG